MSNLKVDRDQDYMRKMWGTTKLITDYSIQETPKSPQVIQEIMHDDLSAHNFIISEELHQKIRNDEDYDDWDYGTEPSYGHPWSHINKKIN
jgi:hypothetical protein